MPPASTPLLQRLGITHLVFGGVTTEVCVQTTMREANDRGYDCLLVEDATASYFPAVQDADDRDDCRARRHRRLGCGAAGRAVRARRRRHGLTRLILTRLLAALPNLLGVIVDHLHPDARIAGRPGRLLRGRRRHAGGGRAGARATWAGPAAARAVLQLRRRRWRMATSGLSLTTGQPVLQELLLRLPASLELVLLALVLACAIALPLGRAGRHATGLMGRPVVPVDHHRRRVAADLLHRAAAGLRLLLPARLGALAAGPARPDVFAARAESPACT